MYNVFHICIVSVVVIKFVCALYISLRSKGAFLIHLNHHTVSDVYAKCERRNFILLDVLEIRFAKSFEQI